jgi:hypothetical protein
MNFLVIMRDVMPIGGDEWDEVLDRHSVRYPGREVDSLRRKFSQLHRKLTPTGDPVCPKEVKLAKRVKYQISSRADVGDGNEEMDLATGIFTTNVLDDPEEETETEDNDMERLDDEVPGEFDAPSVPNDDLLVLANAVDIPNGNLPSAQEEQDNDSVKTSDIRGYQDLPLRSSSPRPTTPTTPTTVTAPAPTTPTTSSTTRTRTPTTPTSRGSASARPLVSPYDRRGNKSSPHQDGLAKMMEMSMVQHNQYMEVERQRRGEEREDRKAMHDMLAKVVSGAFESFNKYTSKNKDDDDEE